MRGKATVDPEKQLLRFEFEERATMRDWKEGLATLFQLSEETGLTRVLVDVRKQKAVAPMAELFSFGAEIPSGMAFAVLSEPHRQDHKFVETVALNRGRNVNLFFGPEEDAVAWLMNWPNKSAAEK